MINKDTLLEGFRLHDSLKQTPINGKYDEELYLKNSNEYRNWLWRYGYLMINELIEALYYSKERKRNAYNSANNRNHCRFNPSKYYY